MTHHRNYFKYKLSLIVLLLTGCFYLGACSNNASQEDSEPPVEIPMQKPTTAGEQADSTSANHQANSYHMAPEATFKNQKGEEISLSSLKGKVVFINFWATWCGPCKVELPSIETLKHSFSEKDPIVFLMVDVDDNISQSQDYINKNKLDFSVFTPVSAIPSAFLGNAIPSTVIINKKGELVARIEGSRDYSHPDIKAAIKEWVEENI